MFVIEKISLVNAQNVSMCRMAHAVNPLHLIQAKSLHDSIFYCVCVTISTNNNNNK